MKYDVKSKELTIKWERPSSDGGREDMFYSVWHRDPPNENFTRMKNITQSTVSLSSNVTQWECGFIASMRNVAGCDAHTGVQ